MENATISIYTRSKLLVFSMLCPTCEFCEYSRGGPHHLDRTPTEHPSIRSHLTVACLWQLCLFRHGVHGGSTTTGRVLYRCTSKQRHDHRTASALPSIRSHLTEACLWQLCLFRHGVHGGSTGEAGVLYRCTSKQRRDHRSARAHPSIRSHLTEACPRQLCLFRHRVHGGGTAEAKCEMYTQSASWRSLHNNTRLTSKIKYGKRHYYLENATISIYTRSKLLFFFLLCPTC